jgi:apolipoprotein N-acyltransferase
MDQRDWHRRRVQRTPIESGTGYCPLVASSGLARFSVNLAEDFLYSGGSALLLLIANLFPNYWYLSFIALFPFLWRISKACPKEALRLGFLLGLVFFTISNLDALLAAPASALPKILCGTLLFALWGWAVGRAKQLCGFNPIIVSTLWVFFELGLIRLGYTSGFVTHSVPSAPFLLRLLTLFGFAAISSVIVLLNSLLVKAVEYAVKVFKANRPEFRSTHCWLYFAGGVHLRPQKFFLIPHLRAPPMPQL